MKTVIVKKSDWKYSTVRDEYYIGDYDKPEKIIYRHIRSNGTDWWGGHNIEIVNKEKVKVIWKEDVDEILNFIKNNIPVV